MATITFESLRQDILQKKFQPVYLLMGNESYFIDMLTNLLEEHVLTEMERDFNMTVFYGIDSEVEAIISAARRYPMMAKRQLIIVKEAQHLRKIEMLDVYTKNPLPSTVLVLNYKNGTIDKRKAVVKNSAKNGIIFESKKLYDNQVPAFIFSYYHERNIEIDQKSAQMLTDFVGTDLSRLIKELEKLQVSLPEDEKRITSDLVEKNVGISKNFNNFELLKAVVDKNRKKAFQIVDYFDKNPKEHPIIMTVSVLFNFFNNLIECYWLSNKSEQNVMRTLNLRSNFFARDYMTALRNYNVHKVIEIISLLRIYDGKSKGVDNISVSQGDLSRELIYKIMN